MKEVQGILRMEWGLEVRTFKKGGAKGRIREDISVKGIFSIKRLGFGVLVWFR